MTLLASHLLWLLAIPAGMAVVLLRAATRRRAALARLSDAPPRAGGLHRRWWCLVAAQVALVVALARPATNPHTEPVVAVARDTVFVLDVSRSMLAHDCPPSRLEAARLGIAGCLDLFPADRLALVAFAGSASIRCPPTRDRAVFLNLLQGAGPDTVAHGGTRLGDALRKVHDRLVRRGRLDGCDVVILSDGGDHDNQPVVAARALVELGARLIVVGMGDHQFGDRVPRADGGFATRTDGSEVYVRLEEDLLRSVAAADPGGVYVRSGTAACDLATLLRRVRWSAPPEATEVGRTQVYDELAPWALALAAVLLLIGLLPAWPRPAVAAAALALTLAGCGSDPLAEGCAALQRGELQAAGEHLEASPITFAQQSALGVCRQREGRLALALGAFRQAAALARDRSEHSLATYNLGTCLALLGERQLDEPGIDTEVEHPLPEAERLLRLVVVDGDPALAESASANLARVLRLQREPPSPAGPPSDQAAAQDPNAAQPQTSDPPPDSTQQPQGDTAMQFDNLDLPPPSLTPAEILREQQAGAAQRRQRTGSAKPVAQDW